MTTPPAAEHMAKHIVTQLVRHRSQRKAIGDDRSLPPLIVGVQGPQGSGKTFLTTQTQAILTRAPHHLHVALLSLDDLYLPHNALSALATEHAHNALLQGRGLPGTHDIPLGTSLLAAFREINAPGTPGGREVTVPVFDKSLHGGEGDRRPEEEGVVIRAPVDVVLVEGWMVGFCPNSVDELERRYAAPVPGLSPDQFSLAQFSKEDIVDVNARLAAYVAWWDYFDTFIQISAADDASPYAPIYGWRLQQEHAMKARNGGHGMSDEQIARFVDRYIPGYIFFGDGVTEGALGADDMRRPPNYVGHGLRIRISDSREVLRVEEF